ncbi:MAG: 3-hydroxyacyl-CoA dehydrogenase [Enterobacteriaceae bacterium]
MMTDTPQMHTIGIVGAGFMGTGIAQILAQAGMRVLLFDTRPHAATEARDAVIAILEMLTGKGKITQAQASAAAGLITVTAQLSELSHCDIVIEAIVENLNAKQSLFRELESVVGNDCILVSNTSSFSVTAIAAQCQRASRVAGLHFFSPVPLMKVAEVVATPLTHANVIDILTAVVRQTGHTPINSNDTPGFVINHVGRGYMTEALAILDEKIAPCHTLDRLLKLSGGFPMGPLELLDLTGLDVSHPATESIYNQYYQDPFFRPSHTTQQRMTARLLGRKSGQGFYHYINGKKQEPPTPALPTTLPASVWCPAESRAAFPQTDALLSSLGMPLSDSVKPQPDSLCLLPLLGEDLTSCTQRLGLNPQHCVAFDPLFLSGARTLMLTPVTLPEYRDYALALLSLDATPVYAIQDSPGFICQRVIATIVNVASNTAQQQVAAPEVIDRAVTLGLGYPKGPLAMGDALGAATLVKILEALFDFYHDPRYRVSPWLKRRAQLGMSLLTPSTSLM